MSTLFRRQHYRFLIESVLYGPRLSVDRESRTQALRAMVDAFKEDPAFDREKFLEYYDAMEKWPKSKPRPPRVSLAPKQNTLYPE